MFPNHNNKYMTCGKKGTTLENKVCFKNYENKTKQDRFVSTRGRARKKIIINK